MAMSKKHFEAVAATIADAAVFTDGEGESMRVDIADRLAVIFAGDNHLFDRDRFLAACDVDPAVIR
jgi:hypothetical protein